MEHKLSGSKAILVVSPLVAPMEDQVYILKKHGVRASILGSSTSVAKENIATVECLGRDNFLFLAPEALTTVKWWDAFEREGFFSRIVCVKVVSLYPIKSIMDRSIFALFLIRTHRRARARGLGGMIKKIVTSLMVHVMDLICLYLS